MIISYKGFAYERDVVKCRRALLQRQIEGEVENMHDMAKAVGISRSTASRFFAGRPTSLFVTLRILRVIGLKFEDVHRLCDEGAGLGATSPTGPG